jgi:hypothetical protein
MSTTTKAKWAFLRSDPIDIEARAKALFLSTQTGARNAKAVDGWDFIGSDELYMDEK